MKKLILVLALFITTGILAEGSCEKEPCQKLSSEQQDCVIKERCNPLIAKLQKRIKDLEDEVDDLKRDNDILLISVHHMPEKKVDKNRVSLLVGESQTRLASKELSHVVQVEQRNENNIGLQYSRDISDDVALLIQATLNRSWMVGFGLKF